MAVWKLPALVPFSIFHTISGAFLGTAVRSPLITTKALLLQGLEGLEAYSTAKGAKHATEAAIRKIYSSANLSACNNTSRACWRLLNEIYIYFFI